MSLEASIVRAGLGYTGGEEDRRATSGLYESEWWIEDGSESGLESDYFKG